MQTDPPTFDPLLDFLSASTSGQPTFERKLSRSFSDLSLTNEPDTGNALENPTIADLMKTLLEASQLHAGTLSTKQSHEQEVQNLSNSLWSFPPAEQQQAKGICGCGNTVVYPYTSQALKFNDQAFVGLQQKFQWLSSFNSRAVFLSLFEQTVAELQLIRQAHAVIEKVAKGNDINDLKAFLEILFIGLKFDPPQPSVPQKVPSAHTIGVIQRMVLLLGTTWLTLQKTAKHKAQTQLLDLEEKEKDTTEEEIPQQDKEYKVFLIKHIAEALGAKWAQSIIQPDVSDLFGSGWLDVLFHPNTEKCWLVEADYIAALSQVPWLGLADKEGHSFSYQDVKTYILPELQKGIDMAVRRQFRRMSFLLGDIVVLLSCIFPSDESILRAVMLLARGPWPSEAITYPLLTLLPWHHLSRNGILLAIGELYHLHPLSISQYCALPEQKKMEHRSQFAQLLFNQNEPMKNSFQMEPKLKDVGVSQSAPLFGILVNLVGIYNKEELIDEQSADINIEKFVIEELLFFACVMNTALPTASAMPNQPAQQHPVAVSVRDEACKQLRNLLATAPYLLGYVIHGLGFNLPLLHPETLDSLFSTKIMSSWTVDVNSFNWMCYFLTHRNPPPSHSSGVENDEAVDIWLQTFMLSPPQVQFPPKANALGIQIGSQIMEKVAWASQTPSVRIKALLALLASKPCVNMDWLWAVLLGDVGKSLTSAPLDEAFMKKMLANNFGPLHKERQAITCADELATAQILLTLTVAEQNPDPLQGMEWLVNWGVFQKLTALSQNLSRNITESHPSSPQHAHSVVHTLLLRIIELAARSPEKCWRGLAAFVVDALKDRRRLQEVRNTMFASLSIPENHSQVLTLWTIILTPKVPNDPSACALLDAIFHGMFCERAEFSEVIGIIATRNWDTREIQLFLSNGFPWIAYAALLGYRPKLPSFGGQGTKGDIRETAYWLWKECAVSLGANLLALPFWEQFCILQFEAAGHEPGFGEWLRETLNPHWTKMAQHFEHAGAQRVFYSLYYSLTTWSSDIVPERGNFFSSIEILRAFLSSHPPSWNVEFAIDKSSQDSSLSEGPYRAEHNTDRLVAHLVALLPEPVGRPTSVLESEHNKNGVFQEAIRRHIESLLQHSQQDELPSIIQGLESSISEFSSLVFGLKQIDDDFLELSRKLYQLSSSPFQVTLHCHRGPARCVEPAFISGFSSQIIAGLPTARESIDLNRKTFHEGYMSFFKLSQSIAEIIVMLHNVGAWLLQEPAPSREAAIRLFFGGLRTVLSGKLPPNSPIATSVIKVLHNIGRVYIRNERGLQKKFLHCIVTQSTALSSSAAIRHTEATPHSTLVPPTSVGGQVPPASVSTTTLPRGSPLRRFSETRATLFDLFTPNCLLQGNGDESAIEQWYELLTILADRRPQQLVYEEDALLAEKFDPDLYFSQFASFPRERLEGLLTLIKKLLSSKAFISLGSNTLHSLFKHDPSIPVSEVLILLLGDSSTIDPTAWPIVFAALDFGGFTWQQALQLLKCLSSCFPLPIIVLGHVLQLARRIVSVPAFTLQMQQENVQIYQENDDGMLTSPLWEHLHNFFANTLISVAGNSGWGGPSRKLDSSESPSPGGAQTGRRKRGARQDKLLSDSIGQCLCTMAMLIRDIVASCPPLIDRVWSMYSFLFANYAEPLPSDQMEQLAHQFAQFRWSDATFHLRDSSALREMCRHVLQRREVVCAIFSRLPWHEFERAFHERPKSTPKLIEYEDRDKESDTHLEEDEQRLNRLSKSALYFLKLFLLVNVIAPHIITPELRTLISPPSSRGTSMGDDPQSAFGQTVFSMPWAMIDFSYFEHVFDGTTLLLPLQAKRCVSVLSGDVASSLISNSHYLFDVAKAMKHPVIASDCVREVRSLLFFCLQSRGDPKLVWHLSYAQVIGLVTSIVIPLTREWGSSGHVGPHMLISLLATIEEEWRPPLIVSFSFANSDQGLPPPRSHPKSKAFNETLLGLVTQFAASSTPPVAIELLNTAASALRNVSTLFLIFEETLHSYFTQCTKPNALTEAAASLQRPMDMKWDQFTSLCSSNHTCLTLLVVLCQQRRQLGDADGLEWVKHASLWMSAVVSFVPSAHHDFYVMGLWFFALSLVSDSRWSLQSKELADKLRQLERQLQGYCGSGGAGSMESILGMLSLSRVHVPHNPSPRVVLAAHGCLIFLYRALAARGQQSVAGEMEAHLDKLLNARKQYPEYEAFFAEAESILSPLTDLNTFKHGLVDTLTPIAPFLAHF